MTGNMRQTAPELTCGTLWVTCDNSPTADGTGPQKAPEGTVDMNSIDNLREYVLTAPSICSTTRAILVGYIDGIEREVADMVPLPVDADGEPIHVGDAMDERLPFGGYAAPSPVDTMELSRGAGGYGWMVRLDSESGAFTNPKLLRHHHAPTVEDVLREFADELWNRYCIGGTSSDCGVRELEAEYAAKLTLRGDE